MHDVVADEQGRKRFFKMLGNVDRGLCTAVARFRLGLQADLVGGSERDLCAGEITAAQDQGKEQDI